MRFSSSLRFHPFYLFFSFSIVVMISSFGVKAFATTAKYSPKNIGNAARFMRVSSEPDTSVMISSFVKAFTTAAKYSPKNIRNAARFMSLSSEPDTSVVDVCSQKIGKALETTDVKVTGAYDDPNGSHISIEVVSSLFEGKRAMQRQQLVYKAIWEELQGPVHAVDSMVCKTPQE